MKDNAKAGTQERKPLGFSKRLQKVLNAQQVYFSLLASLDEVSLTAVIYSTVESSRHCGSAQPGTGGAKAHQGSPTYPLKLCQSGQQLFEMFDQCV